MRTIKCLSSKGMSQIIQKLGFDLIIKEGKTIWDICVMDNQGETVFFEKVDIDSTIEPKGKLFYEYPEKIRRCRAIRYAYSKLVRLRLIPYNTSTEGIDMYTINLK